MFRGSSVGQLIGFGLGMGIVHVLSGPDHLSALATLSVGGSWRSFYLGVRWGLGHSTGLILIAIILLSAGNKIDMDKIGSYCDWVVGVFMLALGAYGMYKAIKRERERKQAELLAAERAEAEGPIAAAIQELELGQNGRSVGVGSSEPRYHNPKHQHEADESKQAPPSGQGLGEGQAGAGPALDDDASIVLEEEIKEVKRFHLPAWCHPENPMVIKVMAFAIGVVHGIAGPGGILGVLPAVHLHNNLNASVYLGSFCVTSTLCMGAFAAMYGEVTRRVGNTKNIEFGLGLFSAFLSVAVGVVWITLSATGTLQKVFG